MLPDFPEHSKWLSDAERSLILRRLEDDGSVPATGLAEKQVTQLTLSKVFQIIATPKIFLSGIFYLTICTPGYAYQSVQRNLCALYSKCADLNSRYFAPTIVHSFTTGAIRTQLLSVPPWACGFVASFLAAYTSDRLRHRFLFVILPLCLAVAGYTILLCVQHDHKTQYAATFLIVLGMWVPLPIIICWYVLPQWTLVLIAKYRSDNQRRAGVQ